MIRGARADIEYDRVKYGKFLVSEGDDANHSIGSDGGGEGRGGGEIKYTYSPACRCSENFHFHT